MPAEDGRTASTLVEFKLYHRNQDQRRFRFSIWIARVQTDRQNTSAEMVLKVLGRQEGQMLELDASRLGPGANVDNFSFRHFHRLDGVVTLPAAFEPEAVAVELSLLGEGGADDRTVRIFPWDVPQI